MTGPIFIDFECLMGKPPHPALLGVLIGSDGEDLEQLIIDAELTPARVANRERTRAVEAADAVRTLMAMAAAEDRRIVGWTYFDRDRLGLRLDGRFHRSSKRSSARMISSW